MPRTYRWQKQNIIEGPGKKVNLEFSQFSGLGLPPSVFAGDPEAKHILIDNTTTPKKWSIS